MYLCMLSLVDKEFRSRFIESGTALFPPKETYDATLLNYDSVAFNHCEHANQSCASNCHLSIADTHDVYLFSTMP